MRLLLHTQTSTVVPLKFGNWSLVSSSSILGMWLFIDAGVKFSKNHYIRHFIFILIDVALVCINCTLSNVNDLCVSVLNVIQMQCRSRVWIGLCDLLLETLVVLSKGGGGDKKDKCRSRYDDKEYLTCMILLTAQRPHWMKQFEFPREPELIDLNKSLWRWKSLAWIQLSP